MMLSYQRLKQFFRNCNPILINSTAESHYTQKILLNTFSNREGCYFNKLLIDLLYIQFTTAKCQPSVFSSPFLENTVWPVLHVRLGERG